MVKVVVKEARDVVAERAAEQGEEVEEISKYKTVRLGVLRSVCVISYIDSDRGRSMCNRSGHGNRFLNLNKEITRN